MKLNIKLLKALLGMQNASTNEFVLVSWMFLHAFCIGLFISFYFSTANSVFIDDWGSASLPYGYVGSGILGILIVNIYTRLQSSYSSQWLYKAVFIFIGLLMLLFGVCHLFETLPDHVLSAGLFILTAPLLTLCALETAGLSMLLFDLRQSKRFFALFSSGEIFASILGYLAIPVLIQYVSSVYNFLFLAGIGALLALIVLTAILYKYKTKLKSPIVKKEEQKQSRKSIFKDRYVALIAITVGLSYVAIYFADFGFLAALKTNYPDSNEFIKSISIFFAIVKIGEFLLSVLSGNILGRLGMKFGLSILPILMFLFTALAFSSDWIGGFIEISAIYLMFIFLAANKFIDRVVRKSIEIPAMRILYLPLPSLDRGYIQTKIDGNVQQIGTAAAGVSLIIFSIIFKTDEGGIDMKYFTLAVLPLLAVWIITSSSLVESASLALAFFNKEADSTRSGVDVLLEYFTRHSKSHDWLRSLMKIMNLEPLITPLSTSKNGIPISDVAGSKEQNSDFIKQIKSQSGTDKASSIYQAISQQVPSAKSYIIDLLSSPEYSHLIANSIPGYGDNIVTDLEYVFHRTSLIKIKRKIIGVYKKINTPKTREVLFELMDYHEPEIQHLALESLSRLEFTVQDNQKEFVRKKISEYAENATWIYASLQDIRESENVRLLNQWLAGQLDRISKDILTLIGLLYGSKQTNVIRENLINSDIHEMKVFSLEMLDNLVEKSLSVLFLPLFEDSSWSRKVRKMSNHFPQSRLDLRQRLREIIVMNHAATGLLPKAEAIHTITHYSDKKLDKAIVAVLFNKRPIIYQSAAAVLYNNGDKDYFEDRIHKLPEHEKDKILSIFNSRNTDQSLIYTKVKLLQSFDVLNSAGHDFLIDLASHMNLLKLDEESQVALDSDRKRNKLVWVIEGQLKAVDVHDNFELIEAGSIFWNDTSKLDKLEYFLATRETHLLSIDKRLYFDLMLDDEQLTRNFLDELYMTRFVEPDQQIVQVDS